MKRQTKLVIALGLALTLAASATWAFATGGASPQTDQLRSATNSAIFMFSAAGKSNVGEMCTNLLGSTFGCDLPTANSSTSLPRAGSLNTLIVHPAYNALKTDLIVAVFVNHVPTALFTIIPAGSTQTRIVHGNIAIEGGDSVKIATQGFTSENEAEQLQYAGSVVYQYP